MGILMPKDKTPTLLNYLHNRKNALLQEYFTSLASQSTWKHPVPLTDDACRLHCFCPVPRFQQAFGRLDGIISLRLLRTSDLIQPVLIHSSLLLPLSQWESCVGVTALSCCCNWLSHAPAPCPVPAGACEAVQWARVKICLKPKIWDFQIYFQTVSWAVCDQIHITLVGGKHQVNRSSQGTSFSSDTGQA